MIQHHLTGSNNLYPPDAAPGGVVSEDSGSSPPGNRAVRERHLIHDALQLNHATAVVVFLLHLSSPLVHHTRHGDCGSIASGVNVSGIPEVVLEKGSLKVLATKRDYGKVQLLD